MTFEKPDRFGARPARTDGDKVEAVGGLDVRKALEAGVLAARLRKIISAAEAVHWARPAQPPQDAGAACADSALLPAAETLPAAHEAEAALPDSASSGAVPAEPNTAVEVAVTAQRPVWRRGLHKFAIAMKPLARPLLHRFEMRVRSAVEATGVPGEARHAAAVASRIELTALSSLERLEEGLAQQKDSVAGLARVVSEYRTALEALEGQGSRTAGGLKALPHVLDQRLQAMAHDQTSTLEALSQQGLETAEGLKALPRLANELERRMSVLAGEQSELARSLERVTLAQGQLSERLEAGFGRMEKSLADLATAVAASGRTRSEEMAAIATALADAAQSTRQHRQEVAAGNADLQTEVAGVQRGVAMLAEDYRERFDEVYQRLNRLLSRNAVVLEGGAVVAARSRYGYLLLPAADVPTCTQFAEGVLPEPGTIAVVDSVLTPGACFVDVGANVGMFTLIAAQRVGANGRIIAVEPTPGTARLLRDMCLTNGISGIVDVVEAAAGRGSGRARLNVKVPCGHNSLIQLEGSTAGVDVAVRSLDDIVGQGRVDMVKLDVEGYELEALAGMGQLLRRNRDMVLIVEFGPSHLERAGIAIADWFQAFRDHGLEIWEIAEETGRITTLRSSGLKDIESVNLLIGRRIADRFRNLIGS